MQLLEEYKSDMRKLKTLLERGVDYRTVAAILAQSQYILKDYPDERKYCFAYSKAVKDIALRQYAETFKTEWDEMYWQAMLWEAPELLDSYMIYIEKNREPQARFYMPRRKTLIRIVNKLQMLADDELDELFIHLPGRTGKTQSITEFNAWYASKFPEKSNLYCSYSDGVAKSYYDGLLELLTDPTYLHSEVFPTCKIVATDAKGNTIDLVRKKKYKSVTCKGLTAGLNGLCDCTGIEIGDDLIEGIQDAMNPDILKRKQTIVDNNYIPRAKTGAKRLWCGTSWALRDPYQNRLEFLKNNPKAKYIRWDVIKIPALDENDESNFDYDYDVGFSTQHYQQIRAKFEANEDMASWLAQYQQEPIEREGALFTPEFMRFYKGKDELPAGEPDNIVSACDIAFGGSDFLAFGVLYLYGDEKYLVDCVFDNHEKNITQPRVVQMILRHKVQRSFWEYNNGGEGYRDDIQRMLKQAGYRHNMIGSYAPTGKRKEDRIFDAAPEIREIYFLEDGYRDQDYQKMMQNVFSYKIEGKNKHEDACDMLAYLVKVHRNTPAVAKIINSPF